MLALTAALTVAFTLSSTTPAMAGHSLGIGLLKCKSNQRVEIGLKLTANGGIDGDKTYVFYSQDPNNYDTALKHTLNPRSTWYWLNTGVSFVYVGIFTNSSITWDKRCSNAI